MADGPRQGCELPKWKTTKRGRRCGQVCIDERGKRRFRFVKGVECGGSEPSRTKSEDVTEFSALNGHAKAMAEALGVELERVEPMPLVPLVGLADGVAKRPSRK